MNKNIIEITKDLVQIQTTADRPEELQRVIEYVVQYFKDADNLFIKQYESHHKPSVVISTQDTLNPDILLVGHLDVVPGAPELFTPRMEGSKMYGRGVCDMKSECAILMRLMKEMSVLNDQPNIALMLTTDEEVGGFHGVNYLLNEIGYRSRVAIVPDGGQSPDDIVLTNKGILLLQLTARGKTGHGSRPWLGENAIDKLLRSYTNIQSLFPEVPTSESTWYHTCNIGSIQGGAAANQIPDFATAALDIRFTEESSVENMLSKINDVVEDVEVDVRVSGKPIHTDPDNMFVQMYASSVKEMTGIEATFNKHCGSNDGRFFTELGIPIIVSRPISGDQHSPDEWLDTDSLPVFHRVCLKAIERFHSSFKDK